MKPTAALLIFLFACAVFAQSPKKSVTWKLDNLEKISGRKPEVLGAPQVVKTERGRAVLFDGVGDGLLIDENPLACARAFTIEALFRPDAGGEKEQRWLHIEDTDQTESRALLEIRLNGLEWFLDTFIKSGDARAGAVAENFKHPAGRFYLVALVYDGAEMRHYVDGRLEMTGKIARPAFGRGLTSLGVRQNKIYWFKGAIRKVRFTNRALSPDKFMK